MDTGCQFAASLFGVLSAVAGMSDCGEQGDGFFVIGLGDPRIKDLPVLPGPISPLSGPDQLLIPQSHHLSRRGQAHIQGTFKISS